MELCLYVAVRDARKLDIWTIYDNNLGLSDGTSGRSMEVSDAVNAYGLHMKTYN